VSVEAKWLVHPATGGALPAIAVLPSLSLPMGSPEFSAGHTQFTLSGLFDWSLPGGTSLSLNGDGSRPLDDAGGSDSWTLSSEAGLGVPLQRHWAVSGDVFVSDAQASGATAEWAADAGVEFFPNPSTQLDFIVVHTLSAPDRASGAQLGYSHRWSGW
jgi:hypothetical protein